MTKRRHRTGTLTYSDSRSLPHLLADPKNCDALGGKRVSDPRSVPVTDLLLSNSTGNSAPSAGKTWCPRPALG